MKCLSLFTPEDLETATRVWGCNCGPAALAFALQRPGALDMARHAIPGFAQKRYTSPSMMTIALAFLQRPYDVIGVPRPNASGLSDVEPMFDSKRIALVRIQFTGRWMTDGGGKWAYQHTHWIAAWHEPGTDATPSRGALVYDINGGIMPYPAWDMDLVPALTAAHPQRDGGWHPTHIWRLR